jgi:hypothetical protein
MMRRLALRGRQRVRVVLGITLLALAVLQIVYDAPAWKVLVSTLLGIGNLLTSTLLGDPDL